MTIPYPPLKETTDPATISDLSTALDVIVSIQAKYNDLVEKLEILIAHIRNIK